MSVSFMSSSLKYNNKSTSGEDLKVGTLFFLMYISMICRYVQGTEIYMLNNTSFRDWFMNFKILIPFFRP